MGLILIREMHEKEEGCRMFLFMVKEENICSSFPTVKYRNIWCSRSYHEDHEVLPWMVSWSLICRSSSNYELAFPWLRFQEVIGLRPCSLFLGMMKQKHSVCQGGHGEQEASICLRDLFLWPSGLYSKLPFTFCKKKLVFGHMLCTAKYTWGARRSRCRQPCRTGIV